MSKNNRLMLPYQYPRTREEHGDDTITISKYLDVILERKYLVVAITLIVVMLATFYAFLARPMYEANVLIQIDSNVPQPRNALTDLSGALEKSAGATTEIEVIRSRNILSEVVQQNHSHIAVRPKYFPVLGEPLARVNGNRAGYSFASYWPFSEYAWTPAQAVVSIFNVPEELEEQSFKLTVEDRNKYRVELPDQNVRFDAQVGVQTEIPTDSGPIEIKVDRIAAQPGTPFVLIRRQYDEAVGRLQKSLKITEKGKQSGIISVGLAGPDPKQVRTLVNDIGNEYIRQTVGIRTNEAEKSLVFLNKQLPLIKQELENAEARYNEIRNKYATIDLGEESKVVVQQAAALEMKQLELKQERQRLLSRYENEHMSVQLVNAQLKDISREIEKTNARIKRMPAIEQDVLRATRDMKVNTELYTNLLSTAQQLRQISASRLTATRLLDRAVLPTRPSSPNRPAIIGFSALLGLALGSLAAIWRSKARGEVPDPYTLEMELGMPVTATIPHSPLQKDLYTRIRKNSREISVLPYVAPDDGAVEGLRGFRTVLQSTITGMKNNVVLITGPTAEVGKSFVSANMANVLASIDKKILLIDADMRNGYLHRYFGLDRTNGLSEVLAGHASPEQNLHRNVVHNVDFLSTGDLPNNPAELLASQFFESMIRTLSREYHYILVDTAPVLGFSDALIIAAHAGSVYNVVRDGVTTLAEIEEALRRLKQAGATVTGTIFNDMKGKAYGYGYNAGYRSRAI